MIFAVDSIPAIFGITTDTFIVFSANAFALLGMRALYALLAGASDRFRYLGVGLAFILIFIGAKMLLEWLVHIPVALSLGVIVLALALSIAASLRADRAGPPGGGPPRWASGGGCPVPVPGAAAVRRRALRPGGVGPPVPASASASAVAVPVVRGPPRAVPGERDDLLDAARAVRVADRRRQQARARSLMRSALASESRRPGPACPAPPASASPAASTAAHSDARQAARSPLPQNCVWNGRLELLAQQLAQVLVDVVDAPAGEAAARRCSSRPPASVSCVELRAEHRLQDGVGDQRVEGVHDRGRGAGVHLAVEVAVQPARALRAPRDQQLSICCVARVRRGPVASTP